MTVITPKPEHEVAYQDLIKLCNKHGDAVSAFEMFAIACNMLGKLAAMQDQRTVTQKMVIETLMQNFQLGNQQVIDQLKNSKGSA